MKTRLEYDEVIPEGYQALGKVSAYLGRCGLETGLLHLVYLRISQINGCAYCVDKHSEEALRDGDSEQRVHSVVVWQESPFYTERERAAFAWAESVTLVPKTHVPDEAYSEARTHFSEKEISDLTLAIATMNAWNRMAISFRKLPAARKPVGA
jgi:AhpD family alkylhydroperoxidase